ncbi:peptidoglycan-N-acetylmuramic acid deacetylase PdaA precursor [Oxobacter pfennigii]|uniref:Peptidoglycan-N-acetylmuramic acid deacetylase PdaA n=1 Tax=Oxobacter pfennigii TaxID=36849 RepID=A0A0P8X3I9_9CLOT|nr:delta-lactam-biosynthetic de-N-acetylase [Oxobacter pfennigii]KPU45353.1 peptidoglycan-N-acetylmuramic acid deacetylase PdaA precursor [Oxobacter pfennigii]
MKKAAIMILALFTLLNSASCGLIGQDKIVSEKNPDFVFDDEISSVSNEDNEDIKETANEDTVTPTTPTVPTPKDSIDYPIVDISTLSNEKIVNWMPGRNKEHKVPILSSKFKNILDKYEGYFTGDTENKVIYLTFDEGYENGYTGEILDILKQKGVTAAFFVTLPYIKKNPELVKRMVDEGHIVGNHSETHPSMPDVSDEKVLSEIKNTADYFKEITGKDMPGFFRPPMGEWSERTLYLTNSLGYKTILWSMAHKDWDTNNQPGKAATLDFVNTYYHNGAILLLHAVSKSNTEALGEIIQNLQNNGYRFAPLDELKK